MVSSYSTNNSGGQRGREGGRRFVQGSLPNGRSDTNDWRRKEKPFQLQKEKKTTPKHVPHSTVIRKETLENPWQIQSATSSVASQDFPDLGATTSIEKGKSPAPEPAAPIISKHHKGPARDKAKKAADVSNQHKPVSWSQVVGKGKSPGGPPSVPLTISSHPSPSSGISSSSPSSQSAPFELHAVTSQELPSSNTSGLTFKEMKRRAKQPMMLSDLITVKGESITTAAVVENSFLSSYISSKNAKVRPSFRSTPKDSQGTLVQNPNSLDTSDQIFRRRKQRMTPKPKKLTTLKKIILLEREQKYLSTLAEADLDGSGQETPPPTSAPNNDTTDSDSLPSSQETVMNIADFQQDGKATELEVAATKKVEKRAKAEAEADKNGEVGREQEAEAKEVSTEEDEEYRSAIRTAERLRSIPKPKNPHIVRQYCQNIVAPELNKAATVLLQDLTRFQFNLYQKNPAKAKRKKRVLYGLREVLRNVERGKVKAVIVATNLEENLASGGLNDLVSQIIKGCGKEDQKIPLVFALSKKRLARALNKPKVKVSAVGILSYDGADEQFHSMVAICTSLREEKSLIDHWILKNELNSYGDPPGTAYKHLQGPTYNPKTQQYENRYQYLLSHFKEKPWRLNAKPMPNKPTK